MQEGKDAEGGEDHEKAANQIRGQPVPGEDSEAEQDHHDRHEDVCEVDLH
jgi:hypothetical protein